MPKILNRQKTKEADRPETVAEVQAAITANLEMIAGVEAAKTAAQARRAEAIERGHVDAVREARQDLLAIEDALEIEAAKKTRLAERLQQARERERIADILTGCAELLPLAVEAERELTAAAEGSAKRFNELVGRLKAEHPSAFAGLSQLPPFLWDMGAISGAGGILRVAPEIATAGYATAQAVSAIKRRLGGLA
jgi:hypothetical protein